MSKIQYEETQLFKKDLKKLLKRFRTLQEDIEIVKQHAIRLFHIEKIDSQSIFPIPQFCSDTMQICKIKKFACKALKGQGARSGIRVIYAYYLNSQKVEFIEIYYKGDKENEDRERIESWLKEKGL